MAARLAAPSRSGIAWESLTRARVRSSDGAAEGSVSAALAWSRRSAFASAGPGRGVRIAGQSVGRERCEADHGGAGRGLQGHPHPPSETHDRAMGVAHTYPRPETTPRPAIIGRMNDVVSLRIALAQVNTTVGDIAGNADSGRASAPRAPRRRGPLVVVSRSRRIGGYPAEDLWLKRHFLEAGQAAARGARGRSRGHRRSGRLRRAAAGRPRPQLAPRCSRAARSRPSTARGCCPTTASSTSGATSSRATSPAVIELNGAGVGLTICEDIWFPGRPRPIEAARRSAG